VLAHRQCDGRLGGVDRTITVTGSAGVAVAPDCARLNCGVQVEGSNAQDALRRSNEATHAILDALTAHGVAAADLRTNGPNLWPSERGYHGSNDVAVVVRELGTLGAVIDAVAAAGGPNLTMHGVSFSVSDPGEHLPPVRRAAIRAAHASATDYAAVAGAAVAEVLTISESTGHTPPIVMRADALLVKGTPVEAGAHELRVDVQVTYRLTE
jgi:uncharacterized protein